MANATTTEDGAALKKVKSLATEIRNSSQSSAASSQAAI